MPANLDELTMPFREQSIELLDRCRANGTPMRPFFTVRHPVEQGALWRQSRPRDVVDAKIVQLHELGASYLAQAIEKAGPRNGRWATNAVPGNSWHQWGLAMDCLALTPQGDDPWDTIPGEAGGPGDAFYLFYAEAAEALGLVALGPKIGDWVHVQGPAESAPARLHTWPAIDAEMRQRFGPL